MTLQLHDHVTVWTKAAGAVGGEFAALGEKNVSAALGVIGSIKIGEIAAALTAVADDTSAPEPPHTSAAEDRKEAAKAIANDPLVAISQSLDKIDGQMRGALDEAQMKVEG